MRGLFKIDRLSITDEKAKQIKKTNFPKKIIFNMI